MDRGLDFARGRAASNQKQQWQPATAGGDRRISVRDATAVENPQRKALKAAERPSANANSGGETKVAKEATDAIKKKIRVRFKVKNKRKRPATSEVGDANAGSSRGSKARL